MPIHYLEGMNGGRQHLGCLPCLLVVLLFLASLTYGLFAHAQNFTDTEILKKASHVTKWYAQVETIKAVVTAYTCHESRGDCINARGYRPIENFSIACPRAIALGTQISLEGRQFTCDDRLNAKFPYRYDRYMENPEEAKAFGKQTLEVTIIYAQN